MLFKRPLLNWLIIALTSGLLVACGGSDNESSAPASTVDRSQASSVQQTERDTATGSMASMDDQSEMASADDQSEMAPTDDQTEMASDMAEPMDSDSSMSDASMDEQSADATENPVTVDDDGVAKLTIGSTDTMQYTVRAFTVEAGQDVELTLVHEGSLPIDVMGHNVVILPLDGDYVAFSRQVMNEGGSVDNNYLPDTLQDGLVAWTQLIGGGESDTITFTAPDTPGEYPFLCTFPGHFGVMNGTMTVL